MRILLIVALAPKWNEKLPTIEQKHRNSTAFVRQYTAAQATVNRVNAPHSELWTVDAGKGSIDVETRVHHRSLNHHPWPLRMLEILHVAELASIAVRHRVSLGKRPVHYDAVQQLAGILTGREVVKAVCRELRARPAFALGTDAPIIVSGAHGGQLEAENHHPSQSKLLT